MEYFILLVVALGAATFLLTGLALLYFYFRSNRAEDEYDEWPEMEGDPVRCPTCGAMNPMNTPTCLNCRRPLPRAAYPPPPGYATVPPGPPPLARPTVPTPPPPPQAQYTVPRPRSEQTLAAARSAPPPPSPPPSPHRPPDMPHAWVEGVAGVLQGQHVLIKADTLVGRSTVCDLQVSDPKVSRRHFRIRYANGSFFMQDQQSSRGTAVNGQRVAAQRLRDGDRIDVGDASLIFRVQRS